LRKFNGVISLIAFGLVQVEDIRLAEAFNLEADLASRYYTNVRLSHLIILTLII
jgi:hypothetical protein